MKVREELAWAICTANGGAGKGKCEPWDNCVCGGDADRLAPFVEQATAQARREAYEDAAAIVSDIASGQYEGWLKNPKSSECGGSTAASNTGYLANKALLAKAKGLQ